MSEKITLLPNVQRTSIVFKSGEPVSVICVATTFTGVSYANNGGKVQLSSAGVHGLTTSPAVGASVYVSWSGGAAISGLYKILSVDSTTAITIDLAYSVGLGTPSVALLSTFINVASFKLPTLSSNSKIINSVMSGFAASASAKQIVCYINSTATYNASVTSSSTARSLLCYGWFSGQKSATTPYAFVTNGSSPGSASSSPNSSVSLSSLSSNTFGIALKITAANEVFTMDAYIIEVFI